MDRTCMYGWALLMGEEKSASASEKLPRIGRIAGRYSDDVLRMAISRSRKKDGEAEERAKPEAPSKFYPKSLLKTAVTRWKQELPGLSNESYDRLGSVAKPMQDTIAGINKGTENIARKAGFGIRPASEVWEKNLANAGGGYTTYPGRYLRPEVTNFLGAPRENTILYPGGNPGNLPSIGGTPKKYHGLQHAVSLRHEALEASALDKGLERGVHQSAVMWKPGGNERAGVHASPSVLSGETKLVNETYGGRYLTGLKNMRNKGESDILRSLAGKPSDGPDIYSQKLYKQDYRRMSDVKGLGAFSGDFHKEPGNSLLPVETHNYINK